MKDITATVIVDLSPDEQTIFNSLQKDARWGIKKAQKEGLTIEESSDFDKFYQIYLLSMKEIGVNPETLGHVKSHSSVLFICYKDKVAIAGAILEIVNNVPTLTRAASLSEYRNSQPNNILYWHCITWSKRKGYPNLDLGGWQVNARGNLDGVNKFKERWGKVVYTKRDYPLLRALGRKLVRGSGFFWWLNNKIRRRK